MKKVKGSITVFVSMLSVLLILTSTVFLDIIRIVESLNIGADAFVLAGMATNNTYNRDIFSDLDIELITLPVDDLYNLMNNLISENQSDMSRLETEHYISAYSVPITNNWYYELNKLVNKANSYNGTTTDNTYVNINNNSKDYSDETSQKLYEILNSSEFAEVLADHCEKNMYQIVYDYLECDCEIGIDKYSDRFFNNILGWCTGTERVEGDFDAALTDYSIYDEMVSSYKYGMMADNGEKGFKWFNSADVTHYSEGGAHMQKCDDIVAFAFDRYNQYLDGVTGKTGLKAEIEYMLYGNRTDRENVAKVLSEIFKLRLFTNLRECIDSELYEDDEAIILAINESWYDTLVLKNGGSVSWNKPVTDFTTTLDMEFGEVVDNIPDSITPQEGEMVYEDYLKNQFYLSCYSGQICCDETFYAHFIDMIEYAYGVNGIDCKWYFNVSDNIGISSSSYNRAFSTLGRLFMEWLGYNRNSVIMQ